MKKRFNIPDQSTQAIEFINSLSGLIEVEKVKQSRSNQQNRALHLFFTILSEQMNENGLEFNYNGIRGNTLSTPYTPHLIKEFVWRPIQKTMFNIESTTKINTVQINQILDVLAVHYSEVGIPINFPCEYDYYLKQLELKEKYNLN
jgi:hypothetical protein